MASPLTRSSKRSEGLTTRSSTKNNVVFHPSNELPNIGRKKRRRESLDRGEEKAISNKKARISIEITSRPKAQPKTRSVNSNANSDLPLPHVRRGGSVSKHATRTTTATQTEDTTLPPPSTPPAAAPKPTIHHEKVVNGIRHELERLQPVATGLKDEKRKLRSQEGTRFKSELSLYFPEYDEVIGNDPKEDHILNADTPIIIIDSAKPSTRTTLPRRSNGTSHKYPLKEYPESLFTTLHDAQRVDFSFLDNNFKDDDGDDPLSDIYFESIHRKPERQERTIRNTDKGRAQHEKDQVIRLLEGLQGPDWLKLMGVSGITDSRKKEYEPARRHFIKGCEVIIEKFRTWKEEEKRRKLEKEATLAEADQEEEEDGEGEGEEAEGDGDVSDGDPPDYSDVDASAARQLHEEAIARSAPLSKHVEKKPRVEPIPPAVQKLEKEFKSFFAKPHHREAALGKTRRSGRSSAAWGHPVPEVPQIDFDLPQEFRDENTLKAHARGKRRVRRTSKLEEV